MSKGSGRLAVALALGACALVGCADDIDPDVQPRGLEFPIAQPPPIQGVPAPLPGAHCQIDVEGIGVIDMEEDYLPHVVTCENGGANLEALKAQAIAARSVAYYAIETSGGICNSQGCQVYSCGSDPSALAYQAVEETSGLYLMYNSTLTYGFYVAGDSNVQPPGCVGNPNATTENYVTYNEGRTGTDIEQTSLGFMHDPNDPGYGQNRGCMGQWGARCLENNNGYDVWGILKFFYGDDIEVVQGEGACVIPGADSGNMSTSDGGGIDSSGGMTTVSSSTLSGTDSWGDTGVGSDDAADGGTIGGGTAGEGGGDGLPSGGALPDTFGGTGAADGGCGCRGGRPQATWALTLLLVALGRRRDATSPLARAICN